jgi:hypothetical protein
VLKKILEPRKENERGGWIKLRNEELHNFNACKILAKSRRMREKIWGTQGIEEKWLIYFVG